MDLGQRLRARRDQIALTQAYVARALGVSRELVSMWETGVRTPSEHQLEQLIRLYSKYERAALEADLPQETQARREIERWLDFLDAWARCCEGWGEELPGPQRPPRGLAEDQIITDARRAPTLAVKVREYYRLGLDALPNLQAFLDEHNVLVYRAPLGSIGQGDGGVSGAFYNHPQLGYCLLVNADTTPGRQTFTLAHEYAHALFHYPLRRLISRKGDRDATEKFADTFAAHFVVPGRELRRLVEVEREQGDIDAYQALRLAAYFRVSYATMLVRLREEGCIAAASYWDWRTYSPSEMGKAIGLDPALFRIPRHPLLAHERYPVSVLKRAKWAIRERKLTEDQVAGLLNISDTQILRALFSKPPEAHPEEEQEFSELPF